MRSSQSRSSQKSSVKTARPIEDRALTITALQVACGALAMSTLLSPTASIAAPSAELLQVDAVQKAARVLLAQNSVENGARVSIMQPGYNDVLKGTASILIGIEAKRYPAATLEMFVDGKSATGGPMKIENQTSVPFNWNTALFADGPHRLTVRVTDTQGFRSDSEVQIYINNGRKTDVSAPIMRWLNVRPGDVLRGDKVFQLEASDNFGIKYVWMSVKSAVTPGKPLRMSMVNHPPYTFPFDTRSVPDGLYILDALAWDAFENEGKAESLMFGIANNTMHPTFGPELAEARRNSDNTLSALNPGIAPATPGRRTVVGSAVKPGQAKARTANNLPPAPMDSAERNTEAPSADAMTRVPARIRTTAPTSSRVASSTEKTTQSLRISALPLPGARPGENSGRAAKVSTSKTQNIAPKTGEAAVSLAGRGTLASEAVSRGTGSTTAGREALRSGRITEPVVTSRKTSSGRIAAAPAVALAPTSAAPATSLLDPSVSASRISGAREGSMNRSNPLRFGRVEVQPRNVPDAPPMAVTRDSVSAGLTPMGTNSDAVPTASQAGTAGVPATRAMPSRPLRGTLPEVAALPPTSATPRRKSAAITVSMSDDKASTMPVAHVVRGGDSLLSVAARYGVPVSVLASVNGLQKQISAAPLAAGTKLNLPRTLTISYAGKPVTGDVAAMMVGATGVTPFRFLFEQQGGSLSWDSSAQRVIARNGEQEITLTIGSRTAVVNQEEVMMDLAAFLLSGRTMVPLRFFEKALHAQVEWEPTTGRIYMTMATPQTPK